MSTAEAWHLVHSSIPAAVGITIWLCVMLQAGQQGAAKKARSQAQKVKKAQRKAKMGAADKRNSMPGNRRRTGA